MVRSTVTLRTVCRGILSGRSGQPGGCLTGVDLLDGSGGRGGLPAAGAAVESPARIEALDVRRLRAVRGESLEALSLQAVRGEPR